MVGFDPDQRRCQLEKDLRKFSMELNNFPSDNSQLDEFKSQFSNTISSLENNFRGLLVIKMKWYAELKRILEYSSTILTQSQSISTPNKYFQHYSKHISGSVMEMMQKLFISYGPRAEKTLDETLIMQPKDFEMNFLRTLWRELVRVVLILQDAESPKNVLTTALEAVNESRTNIKDLFRYFKDIYPIVMSDTISKSEYNLLHDQYKSMNTEIDELEEFIKLYKDKSCENESATNANDEMMIAQIDNQLRDVLHNTLHEYENNCRTIFNTILQLKLFNQVQDYNYEAQEIDAMENFNEQILEYDYESLLNELRFYQSIRSLGEDLEVRLYNFLNSIQSKNNRQFDITYNLREIIDIIQTLNTDYAKWMGDGGNEYLEKLYANYGTLCSLLKSKNANCVSLYLSLSNCVINIKKFLDRVLKEESVLKVKCKHVEERDRIQKYDTNKENIESTNRSGYTAGNYGMNSERDNIETERWNMNMQMQSHVRNNNNVNMNQIKSPNIQQPRIFERKSVNKQFDRAEGTNINVINTESTRHTDNNTTERTTERSNESYVNHLKDNYNKNVHTDKDKDYQCKNTNNPKEENDYRKININSNLKRDSSSIKEREDKSDNINNINNNSNNINTSIKDDINPNKQDKQYSMLPELRSKKEIKIEPYIFSRSNNAWKAITPFKYLYVPYSSLNTFLEELNKNFTHLFNKYNPSRNGEIKCKVRKLNYENSNVYTEIYSLSSFESAICQAIQNTNIMKVRVELTYNQ